MERTYSEKSLNTRGRHFSLSFDELLEIQLSTENSDQEVFSSRVLKREKLLFL